MILPYLKFGEENEHFHRDGTKTGLKQGYDVDY
jgi:hypothetical protein